MWLDNKVNSSKTILLVVSRKRLPPASTLHGSEIELVTSHRYLMILTNNPTYSCHMHQDNDQVYWACCITNSTWLPSTVSPTSSVTTVLVSWIHTNCEVSRSPWLRECNHYCLDLHEVLETLPASLYWPLLYPPKEPSRRIPPVINLHPPSLFHNEPPTSFGRSPSIIIIYTRQ